MAENTAPAPVDYHVLRLIVGLVALALAVVTTLVAGTPLDSISASYHVGGTARDILVGSLVAVGAIMTAHNGADRVEFWLSKVAAVAACGVAFFPCTCGETPGHGISVHYSAAVVLFLALTAFCWRFYARARAKALPHAKVVRATIYALCGVGILVAVLTLGADFLMGGAISTRVPRLAFYGEWLGLSAFGVSWLTASRILPLITAKDPADRVRIWR